ncbi:hypothetical protein H6F86_30735 [Phormidium sp. FACHB-592]|uniref:Four helix bundle protein n=1 Tax=Stenomitos frigidus AS-A4 TaxID=2933935 RepID=A0ABV0KH35_9CYAN|nr:MULTISPECIES: hypothetical protein [Cyanophyceae]MBD2035834.1 hypothetical protein [Leptolyngbya sp. FACHB-321]MBD2078190.1 hypothetical protein [Phormidium sp. FACHB-592]
MTQPTIKVSADLSDALLTEICAAASVLTCTCPGYLTRLLRQVRAFRSYTINCIERFPEATETHHWLDQRGDQLEQLLFQTLLELLQKEQLLDATNQVSLSEIAERSRAKALQQIEQL